MHVMILGTRGIPAQHGGFETFAEDLSLHLVARGHVGSSRVDLQACKLEYSIVSPK